MTIEPTPELIEAAREVHTWSRSLKSNQKLKERISLILAALPEEVTNPNPVLPVEPGWYLGNYAASPSGKIAIELLTTGEWVDNTDSVYLTDDFVAARLPLTRLVPEKQRVTAQELSYFNASIAAFTPDRWQRIADYVNSLRA
jgi:hypothetical protein